MPTTELVKNLELAFKSIGEDVKKLLAQDGDLTALTTTQKASLVVAINELDAAVKAIDVKSVIDDAATDTTHAWSAKKVGDEIVAKTAALKAELLGGAGEAYDTLKELADLIDKNKSAIDALKGIAAGHVRFDKAQELTPEQKKQALANIGAASDEAVKAAQAKADEAHTNAATNATAIGTLGNLKTTEKTNVVGAVNEVKGTAERVLKMPLRPRLPPKPLPLRPLPLRVLSTPSRKPLATRRRTSPPSTRLPATVLPPPNLG